MAKPPEPQPIPPTPPGPLRNDPHRTQAEIDALTKGYPQPTPVEQPKKAPLPTPAFAPFKTPVKKKPPGTV